MELVTRSRSLAKIPNLDRFLGSKIRYARWLRPDDKQTFVTWGRKIDAEAIEVNARQWSHSLHRLEDGFISYLRHPAIMKEPFSLIIDRSGIYYDGSQPSDLEDILNELPHRFTKLDQQRTTELIRTIVRIKVSKYNHQFKSFQPASSQGPNILVVDQTWHDRSVFFADANESTFQRMLAEAVQNHPDANIYVKLHPDAQVARKKTYLQGKLPDHVHLVEAGTNVWDVLQAMDHVYTVSSQIGFEALMLDKHVHCYGKAFYAGWGLSHDHCRIERRQSKLSREQLVYGCLVAYPKYIHPASKQSCELEDVLEYLENYLKPSINYPQKIYAIGMSPWKRKFLSHYLRGHYCQDLHFVGKGRLSKPVQNKDTAALVWGYHHEKEVERIRSLGFPIIRVEDGLIRSVGLGSDLKNPLSLVLSRDDLHFHGQAQTELSKIIQTYPFSEKLIKKAAALRQLIVKHQISKYNLKPLQTKLSKPDQQVCLVIGQVPGDASLKYGSGHCHTDIDLLNLVRKKHPASKIYYRPHPDTLAGNRPAWQVPSSLYDRLVAHDPLHACFEIADSIHTISSSCGFEALLFDKKVYTYGRPFYAGWGLTIDAESFPERQAQIGLDQLVAAALILYPIYKAPTSKAPDTPETIIERIVHERALLKPRELKKQLWSRTLRRAKYLFANSWERI